MIVRESVVSGQFYPSSRIKLTSLIQSFVNEKKEKIHAKAVLSPHAGYVYSGAVAGELFSSIIIPDTVVLLGPNHTGLGRRFSTMKEGLWETPLGKVNINTELAGLILSKFNKLEDDYYAHLKEHSLEVQLPFLQFFNPNVKIVPISIMRGTYQELNLLGSAIADSIINYSEDVLIVISSDMSHYISHEEASKKDKMAIDKIIALDGEGLIDVCERYDITMCGVFPAVVGLSAVKSLNVKEGKLIKYTTSGEVSGDFDYVVGYAGIILA